MLGLYSVLQMMYTKMNGINDLVSWAGFHLKWNLFLSCPMHTDNDMIIILKNNSLLINCLTSIVIDIDI